MRHDLHGNLKEFKPSTGKSGKLYSLAALEKAKLGKISRLPVSIRALPVACSGSRI
jgi:aconitate hydratase